MRRLAIFEPGDDRDSLARIVPLLRGVACVAVVDSEPDRAAWLARELGECSAAATLDRIPQPVRDSIDDWLVPGPGGWALVPNRSVEFVRSAEFAAWDALQDDWLWAPVASCAPRTQLAGEAVSSGKLGAVGLVRVHDWTPGTVPGLDDTLLSWLHVTCWLMGQPPTLLMAVAPAQEPPAGTIPRRYLQVHLGFAGDGSALIDCAIEVPSSQAYVSLNLIGAAGAYYADDHHNQQLVLADGQSFAVAATTRDAALQGALREYVATRESGCAAICGPTAWRRARRLLAAVHESLARGAAVRIDDDRELTT